jgi:hypothetical protein
MTYAEFADLIDRAASQMALVGEQRVINPYRDHGWPKYLVAHGTDHVILELLRPPRPNDTGGVSLADGQRLDEG